MCVDRKLSGEQLLQRLHATVIFVGDQRVEMCHVASCGLQQPARHGSSLKCSHVIVANSQHHHHVPVELLFNRDNLFVHHVVRQRHFVCVSRNMFCTCSPGAGSCTSQLKNAWGCVIRSSNIKVCLCMHACILTAFCRDLLCASGAEDMS